MLWVLSIISSQVVLYQFWVTKKGLFDWNCLPNKQPHCGLLCQSWQFCILVVFLETLHRFRYFLLTTFYWGDTFVLKEMQNAELLHNLSIMSTVFIPCFSSFHLLRSACLFCVKYFKRFLYSRFKMWVVWGLISFNWFWMIDQNKTKALPLGFFKGFKGIWNRYIYKRSRSNLKGNLLKDSIILISKAHGRLSV